jgi:hypothetical protein
MLLRILTAASIGLASFLASPFLASPAHADGNGIPKSALRGNARYAPQHAAPRNWRGPVRSVVIDRRVPVVQRSGVPTPVLMYDPSYRSQAIYGDAFYQDPVGFYVHNTFYWGRDFNPIYHPLHFRVCRSQDYLVVTPNGGPETARMVHC